MKQILKNYKTTIPGILSIVAVGLYWVGYITTEQFISGTAILVSAGLIGSKHID